MPSAADSQYAKPRLVPHDRLVERLVQRGYENIIIQTSAPLTLASFEDAAYRNSVSGLSQAMRQTILHLPPSNRRVFLIIQKYGVPVAGFFSRNVDSVTLPKSGRTVVLPHMAVSDQTATFWRYYRRIYPANSSVLKSDLIVHPDVRAVLGNYDNPIALQINVMPELRMVLFAGGVLSVSMIASIYDEFDDDDGLIRFGPSSFNYFRALPHSVWIYTSLGYFYDEQYGAQAQIRKLQNEGRWALDARIGYTGYAVMNRGGFLYSPMETLTWSLETTYFFRSLQLFVSAGYHRFIEQDRGWRFDMFRFFGNLRLGFWAGAGGSQWNGGFRVALPLPPSRYRPRHAFRVRTADYMRIGYVGRREISTGRILEKSELMDDLLIYSFPAYLQSHINLRR